MIMELYCFTLLRERPVLLKTWAISFGFSSAHSGGDRSEFFHLPTSSLS